MSSLGMYSALNLVMAVEGAGRCGGGVGAASAVGSALGCIITSVLRGV
ncbi:hypothetical protein [Thermoproteus tenax]|nr:hypothetical protein [Thermoproteus tenax]